MLQWTLDSSHVTSRPWWCRLVIRICQGVTRQAMVAFKRNSYDDDHFARSSLLLKSQQMIQKWSRLMNEITEAVNNRETLRQCLMTRGGGGR